MAQELASRGSGSGSGVGRGRGGGSVSPRRVGGQGRGAGRGVGALDSDGGREGKAILVVGAPGTPPPFLDFNPSYMEHHHGVPIKESLSYMTMVCRGSITATTI